MPVEIVQFCWQYNLNRLANLPSVKGCEAKLRMEGDKPYVTDNGCGLKKIVILPLIYVLMGMLRMEGDKPYVTDNGCAKHAAFVQR